MEMSGRQTEKQLGNREVAKEEQKGSEGAKEGKREVLKQEHRENELR